MIITYSYTDQYKVVGINTTIDWFGYIIPVIISDVPDIRIVTILSEDRVVIISSESRIVEIDTEDRTVTIT